MPRSPTRTRRRLLRSRPRQLRRSKRAPKSPQPTRHRRSPLRQLLRRSKTLIPLRSTLGGTPALPTWAIRAFFFAGLRIYCVSVATRAAGTYLSTPPCPRASFLVSASNRQKIALAALSRPLGSIRPLVALSRPLGSIRPLVAPISHSLNTALIELRQRCRKATIELLDACVDVHLATFL